MTRERRAGLLVHPTSLPGPFGIGDAGETTIRFLDWAAEAGSSVWQFLPLGPTGSGASPYSAPSAFAGNPLLISPGDLARRGWLGPDPPAVPSLAPDRVAFERVAPWKHELLRAAHARFASSASREDRLSFEAFCSDALQADWLEDWVLFAALREHHGGRPWTDWEAGLRDRQSEALRSAGKRLAERVRFHRFVQFAFSVQWGELRRQARARGIRLLGDLPFYCAHDSADVWAHRDGFELDDAGRPLLVSGVPPDYFSDTGQLWGQPVYRWDRMAEDGFRFWVSRLRAALTHADEVRLDHFRGFESCWVVAAGAATAVDGRWVQGPGRGPFDAARRVLGSLPLIAEDLGDITPAVETLRRELGLPGMKVLQFGLDGQCVHLPETWGPEDVAYTGTHDNDTMRGWFESLDAERRGAVLRALSAEPSTVVERAVEMLYDSPAGLVVVPLQDVLDLDGTARMNVPGVAEGNWAWRVPAQRLRLDVAERLRLLGARSGRLL